MSGRIAAVAVVEGQPAVQYVGAAAGGVWKTTDDGLSWKCVFPGRPNASIGAIAVAPSDPNVVWVGTGEANPRNSVSWGNGVFVSRDAGWTWEHCGLSETHHIGRIVVHPRDPDVAYVAGLGHLWGPNPQRGVFRTRDGGKTWDHVLRIDADTGCIDLAIDHLDPRTLYASAYRVRRGGFSGPLPAVEFGPRAGLYRSRDGGETWKRLTQGLPARPLGRCGLAVWRRDPRVLYTVVQTDRTDTRRIPGQPPGRGPIDTGGVFRSRDRGETWVKVNDLCPRPFYFGQIRIDPTDENRIWVLGIPLYVTADGGRTFRGDGALGVHVDHHDLWIDPADPRHLVLATDGGLYYSRQRGGKAWTHVRNLPLSQYYGIAVDMRSPYHIYGGLQDNGSWGGPSRTGNPAGILNGDWRQVLRMDGFHCQVAPDDPATVYAEGQYGRLHRLDLRSRRAFPIRPQSSRGETFRFNWSSPILLSAHSTSTIYYGGNYLFKSTDRGATWAALSSDLTRGQPGTLYRSTGHALTAIAESPLRPGVLYAGSDDGKVHVTRDDGRTWTDVTLRLPGLPQARWVTRIECSPHAVGTVYLAASRHRQDDRAPYLFQSDDFGQTWRPLAADLPAEGPVLVIRCDARNKDLLYAGTEFGLFVSLDAGESWQRPGEPGGVSPGSEVPPAPVHDLVVHPRDRELVVATHGRGLFVLDVAPLQDLATARSSKVRLFEPRPAALNRSAAKKQPGPREYAGANPPGGAVLYYLLREPVAGAKLEILSPAGGVVASLPVSGDRGLHRVVWDLRGAAGKAVVPVAPGEHRLRLTAGGIVRQRKLKVEAGH
jgi:photosystem II stability/assembly factor-like uncharacterized protein